MKRTFKIVSKVFLSLATAFLLLAIALAGIIKGSFELLLVSSTITMPFVLFGAITGVLLIGSKNDTVCKIGHGLAVSAFIIAFSFGWANIGSTCASFLIIAGIMMLLHYIFLLVVSIMNRGSKEIDNPQDDHRIARVREWKQILDEGIITEKEFEEKRVEILKLKK